MAFIEYLVLGVIGLLLIIAIAVFLINYKVKEKEFKKTGKYPKGHYMGQGIAMGIPIGIPIGLILGNIAIGPAIGVAIGIALGSYLENKHKDELRPMTEAEEKAKEKTMLALAGAALLGIVLFVAFLLLKG
jgi:heme/copper-type cytochrome/quinol oxidase subunit 2